MATGMDRGALSCLRIEINDTDPVATNISDESLRLISKAGNVESPETGFSGLSSPAHAEVLRGAGDRLGPITGCYKSVATY